MGGLWDVSHQFLFYLNGTAFFKSTFNRFVQNIQNSVGNDGDIRQNFQNAFMIDTHTPVFMNLNERDSEVSIVLKDFRDFAFTSATFWQPLLPSNYMI